MKKKKFKLLKLNKKTVSIVRLNKIKGGTDFTLTGDVTGIAETDNCSG